MEKSLKASKWDWILIAVLLVVASAWANSDTAIAGTATEVPAFAQPGMVAGLSQVELVDYLREADTQRFENDSCKRVRIRTDLVQSDIPGGMSVLYSCRTQILEKQDLTYWVFETQEDATEYFDELVAQVSEEFGNAEYEHSGGQEEYDGATVSIFADDIMRSTRIVARAQNVVLFAAVDGGFKSDSEYHFLFGSGLLIDGLNHLWKAERVD